MKKILAIAAVLAIAGSASANSFAVNGAVDSSEGEVAGGLGAGLVFEGAANYGFFGGLLNPGSISVGTAHSGAFLSTPDGSDFGMPPAGGTGVTFAPGGSFDANGFRKAWFNAVAGGIPSAAIPSLGLQGVHIFYADAGVTGISLNPNVNGGRISIFIDGNLNPVGFDQPNENGFQLFALPNETFGGFNLYVAFVPTPGAAGLLGLAGLAAVRRRR